MLTIGLERRGSGSIAMVRGLDPTRALDAADFARMLAALGEHGVLCCPDQHIDARSLANFSAQFGTLHYSSVNAHCAPGVPQVTVLSNIMQDGQRIGVHDAGQEWHTDSSYTRPVGFAITLLARQVPLRDGRPRGATEFANTQAAWRDLPDDLKTSLATATATHSLPWYWEFMRTVRGSQRAPMTAEQQAQLPPTSQPVFMTHPVTGNKVIYVNPSLTEKIDGMEPAESRRTLDRLYAHILQDRYRYVHEWRVGDLVLCDLIGTWHYAVADYGPDEPRLVERCQVLGDKALDPAFVAAALRGLPGREVR